MAVRSARMRTSRNWRRPTRILKAVMAVACPISDRSISKGRATGILKAAMAVACPISDSCAGDHKMYTVKSSLVEREPGSFKTAFSPAAMPTLSHLNLRGNQLNETYVGDLMELQSGFTFLEELEVDIPGLFGSSAVKILEYLPSISVLNGVNRSSIIEHGKHVIDQGSSFPIHAGGETGISSEVFPLGNGVVSSHWKYFVIKVFTNRRSGMMSSAVLAMKYCIKQLLHSCGITKHTMDVSITKISCLYGCQITTFMYICPEGSAAAMKVGEPRADNCFSDREFKIIQVT